jgi:hypothetical protein
MAWPVVDAELAFGRIEMPSSLFENMRKLVYAFYNPNFSFKDVVMKYPDAGGEITDCLSGDVNKDYSSLWAKIREFAPIPDELPYGMPMAA